MLRTDVDGRATFLVHPNDGQANFPFAEGQTSTATLNIPGVVSLKDCVRILDGFGRSLEVILPKLREGFVAPDALTARSLALSNPQSFFLSPTGETFHNVTVTGAVPTPAVRSPSSASSARSSRSSIKSSRISRRPMSRSPPFSATSTSSPPPSNPPSRSAAKPSASPPTPAPPSARWNPRPPA